jgi:hypothetical protein
MTRIIIKAVPNKRIDCYDYLKNNLKDAEWVFDTDGNAMNTFLRALDTAKYDECIHMEDDVILTNNFIYKINEAIKKMPSNVINFFSMRKNDLIIGSRFDNKYCMNQCVYLPKNYSAMLLDYYKNWNRLIEHPTGTDYMLNDFLKSRKEKHYIYVPSLVQHRIVKSIINPKRSSKRISMSFEY